MGEQEHEVMRDPEHRYKAKKSAMVDPAYFPLPFFIMQEVAQMTRGEKACLRLAKWKKLPLHVSR